MSGCLKITYTDDFSDQLALAYAARVVSKGKVSQASIDGVDVPHYCWVTIWEGGTIAYTRRKRTPDSADSIHIYKEGRP